MIVGSILLSSFGGISRVNAHGYLKFPMSRNLWQNHAGYDYDPQSAIYNNKEHTSQHCGGWKGHEEYDSRPWKKWEVLTDINDSTFEMTLVITANHGGNHHLNYVCMDGESPKTLPHQVPAEKWQWLERADGETDYFFNKEYRYEFFVPSKRQQHLLKKQPERYRQNDNGNWEAKSKWKTPKKACQHGILRWEWETANTCISQTFSRRMNQRPMDKNTWNSIYQNNIDMCSAPPFAGERFLNCADVAIRSGGIGNAIRENVPFTAPARSSGFLVPGGGKDTHPSCYTNWKDQCHNPSVFSTCPINCGASCAIGDTPSVAFNLLFALALLV